MSVGRLVEVIEAEAEAEAGAILGRATAEAGAIVEAARQRAAEQVEAARAAAERAARTEASRTVNALRLQNVGARAEVLAESVEAVFRAAGEDATAIADGGDPELWARALRRLVDEAVAVAGPQAMSAVREIDADAVREAVASAGARLEVVADPALPAGLVTCSADGRIEVDATLPVRLARARDQLAGEVALLLGAADAPPGADTPGEAGR
jgi:vacuolar-type H+-ATPase subunit E/Vma4